MDCNSTSVAIPSYTTLIYATISTFFAADHALCIFGKSVVQEGETFAKDRCTTCVCKDGKLDCTKLVCPELHCGAYERPGKYEGDCCSVCIPTPVVDPLMRTSAASCQEEGGFTDPANPCLRCTCQNGNKVCLNVAGSCEPLSCERTVHVPGQCCPQCDQTREELGEPAYCQENGKLIPHGSSFFRDSCTTCTCSNGVLSCATRTSCPVTECPRGKIPVTRAGECCQVCEEIPRALPPPSSCTSGETKRVGDCQFCRCIDGEYVCYYNYRFCPEALQRDSSAKSDNLPFKSELKVRN